MILVVGAGLSGMSFSLHAREDDVLLVEKEREVGGLCRSIRVEGFTFDYTGHLLHLRDPSMEGWVKEVLPDWRLHHRRAAIHLGRTLIPYPFQANLWALPPSLKRECLEGYRRREAKGEGFVSWVKGNFGEGMAHHFFLPYNRKLWLYPLEEMAPEWAERFIPIPDPSQVEEGAKAPPNRNYGYHHRFLYPSSGGIGAFSEALGKGIKNLLLGKELVALRIAPKEAVFSDGEIIRYDRLIATLPLVELLRRIEDLPEEGEEWLRRLRYVSVTALHLGIEGKVNFPYHWIYFPEPEYPFYRVGFPSSLSPSMAPQGMRSMTVEVAHLPDQSLDRESLKDGCLRGLRRSGLLEEGERVVVMRVSEIRHAYVFFDRWRGENLSRIMAFLRKGGIYPLGRYARWEYSTMEDALREGRALARELAG